MKTISHLFSLFILLACITALTNSCQKELEIPPASRVDSMNIDTPQIVFYIPVSPTNNNTIVVYGENLGQSLNLFVIKIDTIVMPAITVSNDSFSFHIPAGFVTSTRQFQLSVSVNGIRSNSLTFTVSVQPQNQSGWRYLTKTANMPANPAMGKLWFFDDANGFLYGGSCILSTYDSGYNWMNTAGYAIGEAFSVNNNRYVWFERNGDLAVMDRIAGYNYSARFDTLTSVPKLQNKYPTGFYNTGLTTGYILTSEGRIFKANGGLAPPQLTLEYESQFSFTESYYVRGFHQISGLNDQNFTVIGNPRINSNLLRPVIINKVNGQYQEFDMSTMLNSAPINYVQLLAPNNLLLLTGSYQLFRFNGTSVTNLNAPQFSTFSFTDTQVGYALPVWNMAGTFNRVYKTVDSGQTWTVDFQMDPEFLGKSIFIKNGKVWITGSNSFPGSGFILNYTP